MQCRTSMNNVELKHNNTWDKHKRDITSHQCNRTTVHEKEILKCHQNYSEYDSNNVQGIQPMDTSDHLSEESENTQRVIIVHQKDVLRRDSNSDGFNHMGRYNSDVAQGKGLYHQCTLNGKTTEDGIVPHLETTKGIDGTSKPEASCYDHDLCLSQFCCSQKVEDPILNGPCFAKPSEFYFRLKSLQNSKNGHNC